MYLLDTLDEDDDTLGEVPRALRLHKQRLKTLERMVLAESERSEAGTVPSGLSQPMSRRAGGLSRQGPNDNGKIAKSA